MGEIEVLLSETLLAQQSWSHENTPTMQRRGVLIRREIPQWLEARLGDTILESPQYALRVQGRDGTGRKTEIPWIRIYNKEHSPNAREGWYCVFLFHARGEGFYLALDHGSTRWENGEFKPRSAEELSRLVAWANTTLEGLLPEEAQLTSKIDLGAKGDLGDAYERGTVTAKWYPASKLPGAEELFADLSLFLKLLSTLYESEGLSLSPEGIVIQAREAVAAVERLSRPQKRGQGFGLTAEERMAVERCAMDRALEYLVGQGFAVQDVSKTKSYDFIATKDAISFVVEVKGTTGDGGSIIVTANEVVAHQDNYPHNALIVVHSIKLHRGPTSPSALGGTVAVSLPWDISAAKLIPLSFQCVLR